jgi:hypothetical protein
VEQQAESQQQAARAAIALGQLEPPNQLLASALLPASPVCLLLTMVLPLPKSLSSIHLTEHGLQLPGIQQ